MADTNDNTNNVTAITEKLENTTLSTQTQSSTAIASGNDTQNTNNPSDQTPITNKNNPTEETKVEQTITVNNNVQQQQQSDTNQQQQPIIQQQVPQQQPQQQQTSENKEPDDDSTNLIINYLPPTMSEGTLATLFSPYGLLERCKIVVDLQTLRSRGYGFVKYDNSVSAERALTALNGYELNGKKLKVAFARPQCKAITNANLYITNVPPHYNDNNLRKLFQDYGKIVECRVLMDQNGQSRGVGFVRMDTHHNAIQALQAMDQYVIDDKHPPLLVKLAQRRVPRRYWNSQNRNQNQGNQGGHNKKYQGGMNNNMGNNGGNKNKKRNSPNRQYYPKKYRQQGGGQGGGQMGGGQGGQQMNNMQDNNMGPPINNMGGNNNRGSPSKRYYRPRQNQFKQNQQKTQYQARRGPNQGGPPYFPAPMYDAPYGMAQYGQPAYATNIHMTAAAINPSNPSVGPKRNKQLGTWD